MMLQSGNSAYAWEKLTGYDIERSNKFVGWKLAVCHRETLRVDFYRIHREVVLFGPRPSEYLGSLWEFGIQQHDQDDVDHNNILTILELPSRLAKTAVPLLLEYMYNGWNGDHEAQWKVMYELAHEWSVTTLQMDVATHIQHHKLSLDNLLDYFQCANAYPRSSPLMTACMDWCAEPLLEVPPLLAAALEPSLLLRILRRNKDMGYGQRVEDFQRSELVVHCVQANNNKRLLTEGLLFLLTEEEMLPFLSPRFEAPEFLLAEARIANLSSIDLSNLQQRCIQSMTTYWKECIAGFDNDMGQVHEFFLQLHTLVLEELLKQTLQDLDRRMGVESKRNTNTHANINKKEGYYEKAGRVGKVLVEWKNDLGKLVDNDTNLPTDHNNTIYTSSKRLFAAVQNLTKKASTEDPNNSNNKEDKSPQQGGMDSRNDREVAVHKADISKRLVQAVQQVIQFRDDTTDEGTTDYSETASDRDSESVASIYRLENSTDLTDVDKCFIDKEILPDLLEVVYYGFEV